MKALKNLFCFSTMQENYYICYQIKFWQFIFAFRPVTFSQWLKMWRSSGELRSYLCSLIHGVNFLKSTNYSLVVRQSITSSLREFLEHTDAINSSLHLHLARQDHGPN